ncbi:methyltransferase [Aureimonas sp. SA4125]|uniref:RraA family protein n=1 Tax=Aureimonas sp. SA4125 TaxID=2826993 RepID=UPI001CC72A79|nr:RraA family protein [Aureimonas sp. SA4125]BDA86586.1 methyltransferase [Aureimonas sp. SA4125]
MPVGFRINRSWTRVDTATVDSFRALPVANVSDAMSRLSSAGPRLRPMHRSGTLAGPALTVRSRPGDNLMLHKAIDMAEPGDVIVMDAGGDLTNSLMGELMLAHAIKRGVGGFVLYGAVRDAEAFLARNLPVFALGVNHRGPYRDGPGEIGYAIAFDGMSIAPGDLVLGDMDGVLSVAYGDTPAVLAGAQKKHQGETRQMEETEAGTFDRSWVDKALERGGCTYSG